MSIIKVINPEYDFWELYPDLKFILEFEDIRKNYKNNSSMIMWFIVMCFDLESKYFELDIDERTTLLSKDYLKDKDWYNNNKDKIIKAIERFEAFDTTTQRQLRQLIETMAKRTKFLRDSEYDIENFDKLDKMVSNTANLFKVFEVIEKQLAKEKGIGTTKGGHELSLADSEEI